MRPPDEPVRNVPTPYTLRRYPLGHMAQYQDGSWNVRLRCPDGKVRKFRSRAEVPAKRTRLGLRSELRFAVLSRDGFRCRYCGRSAPDVVLQVDHIVPVARGGGDDPANLVTACAECNVGKTDSVVA